jgi:1,4-dihydroxy-6-naphthoate synthase
MQLSFGFSPCPNDTFMFDAIANNRIDTQGIDFEVVLEDVEQLNKWALNEKLDVTKLSFATFLQVKDKYQLLNSGSALGHNCGPLLISKENLSKPVQDCVIAIPGINTTANMLLDFAFTDIKVKREMLFSEIEKAILDNSVDAGLIIHESRFTFEEKGLKKILDLGEYWESKTNSPIPLGGIAVRRSLNAELKQKIGAIVKQSVHHAFDFPNDSKSYIKCHAQEMDVKVMQAHIDLYVNDYSKDLGLNGQKAIETLANQYFGKTHDIGELNDLYI